MGIRDCSFDGDGGGTADGGEGGAEENKVVIYADPSGLVAEGGDGGKDVSPCGRGIGLDLQENGDDGSGSIADCTEDVAVTGGVGGRSWAPDVQRQSVKRMRGITITSRAAVDRGDCGLGSSTVRAERKGGELGVAGDAKNTK